MSMQQQQQQPPESSRRTAQDECSDKLIHLSRTHRYVSQLCRHRPAVAMFAMYGVKEAVKQCQAEFKYDRWDCTLSQSSQYTILDQPPIIKYGYRESAYLVALSSAAAAWAVSTACLQGQLAWCSCDMQKHSAEQSWQWGGCSYGVKFGLVTSRRLLTPRTSKADKHLPLVNMYKHNLKAGRMAVKQTVRKNCRCHGVSGSCQMKTCWQVTENLDYISSHLRDKYDHAKQLSMRDNDNNDDDQNNDIVDSNSPQRQTLVTTNNIDQQLDQYRRRHSSNRRRPHHQRRRYNQHDQQSRRRQSRRDLDLPTSAANRVRTSDLVYIEPSPDWCAPIGHLGHAGVSGRSCRWTNGTHSYGDCDRMCCARGYAAQVSTYTQKCNCRFVWCCRVECDYCTKRAVVTRCT